MTALRYSIHLTSDLIRQIQAKALPETIQAAQSNHGDIRTNDANPETRSTKDAEKNRFRLAKEKKANGNKDFGSVVSMTLFKRNGIPSLSRPSLAADICTNKASRNYFDFCNSYKGRGEDDDRLHVVR